LRAFLLRNSDIVDINCRKRGLGLTGQVYPIFKVIQMSRSLKGQGLSIALFIGVSSS
jgi:hypothetical protein